MTLPNDYQIYTTNILTEEDLNDLAYTHQMGRTSYHAFVKPSDLAEITFNNYLENRKKLLADNEVITSVATFQGKIIGFSDYGILSKDNRQRQTQYPTLQLFKGELINIFLQPEHQGLGIGFHLFKLVKDTLVEQKLIPFMLWTLKDNVKARLFYEKNEGKVVPNLELPIRFGQNDYMQVAYRLDG